MFYRGTELSSVEKILIRPIHFEGGESSLYILKNNVNIYRVVSSMVLKYAE